MPPIKKKLRRLKFWWNLILAYLVHYRYRILIITVSLTTLAFAFAKIWPSINRTNTLPIGYVGTYSLETIPSQILSLVTQSLITTDSSGKPIGELASGWTISEDGKTYIVFLKDNLRWHDGTRVSAFDLSIAISQVTVTALNNKAIEFKLPSSVSSFLKALEKPVFKAKSFYGTGPYRIVDIDQVDNTLKKISLVPKNKELPKVDIKFYQTEEQAQSALKIGDIKSITVTNPKTLATWTNLETERITNDSETVTIFLNTQDSLLSKRELRQGLNYAINRSSFDGQAATGPISPSNWAHNHNLKRYDYNTARAKELLAKSGTGNLKIKLTTTAGLEAIAEKIKLDWQAIGFETEIIVEKKVPQSFQALLAINQFGHDPDQYALWHSTQTSTNITGLKNDKVDKLLEDARSEQNEEERRQLYGEFQKSLVEESPAIFLYHPYKYTVTYRNIKHLLAKLPK